MKKSTELSESLEDYLEAILSLEKTKKVARAKDIADKIGVQRGSVTSALKTLAEKELINYEPYSFITLTRQGTEIAEEITYRHAILKNFLLNILQIDEETAEHTACRMEHAVDKKTLERMICFFNFIYSCPKTGADWIQAFLNSCSSPDPINPKRCKKCIDDCKKRILKIGSKDIQKKILGQ
ncbi:MAG: metal-dependent transcriptional regulator [Deltaproteobacteria bacterium]|nr:metal-dependent transcriptional regulator [Deltaproteobacteria bacterium]MBW2219840.1 metal-dependent transcriptional regulator [Deltaproteobacteria bacterium]